MLNAIANSGWFNGITEFVILVYIHTYIHTYILKVRVIL